MFFYLTGFKVIDFQTQEFYGFSRPRDRVYLHHRRTKDSPVESFLETFVHNSREDKRFPRTYLTSRQTVLPISWFLWISILRIHSFMSDTFHSRSVKAYGSFFGIFIFPVHKRVFKGKRYEKIDNSRFQIVFSSKRQRSKRL